MVSLRSYGKSYDYYNAIAQKYDDMYNDKYWESARKHISRIIEKYTGDMRNLSVLDVGAGTGYWALWVAEKGALVTLIEPAENMLQIAVKRLNNYSDKCKFLNIPVEQAPIDQKYDVIFLLGDVLSYVNDPEIVVEKLREYSHQDTLIFGTVDNYYSYLKEVINYGSWDDYMFLQKHRKIQIGSQYGMFISRAFTQEEIKRFTEKYGMETLEISGLAVFDDVRLNEKYGKYFSNEAEHILFALKVL